MTDTPTTIAVPRTAGTLLGSGLFVFVSTYALLVPDRAVWSVLVEGSEPGFFLGAFVACAVLGGAFALLTGVPPAHVVSGGFGAYLLWLLYLEAALGPFDSPAHVVLGAVYLLGFGIGAELVERAHLSGIVARTVRSE